MGFRTIIVNSHSKLEYSMNYLVYRSLEENKRVCLDEINTVIIQSPMVSLTNALLIELINKKIKVIFCDEKSNPLSELTPYYGDSISYRRLSEQLSWSKETMDLVWKEIIQEKILTQAKSLKKYDKPDVEALLELSQQVEPGDITNREGHAAKVYFNRIFHDSFTRNGDDEINAYLNFGYTILLSQFNRTIVAKGYLTQLGIHHKNDFNQFNLSCDLIEPFRYIVDDKAHLVNKDNFKDEMIKLLTINVTIDGKVQSLTNAISIYCASVFRALNENDVSLIKFIESYEL